MYEVQNLKLLYFSTFSKENGSPKIVIAVMFN